LTVVEDADIRGLHSLSKSFRHWISWETMVDEDAGRKKAMAAVQAMFDRYRLIAAKRPKDHIVSYSIDLMRDRPGTGSVAGMPRK
jgi:hypothetical protein